MFNNVLLAVLMHSSDVSCYIFDLVMTHGGLDPKILN